MAIDHSTRRRRDATGGVFVLGPINPFQSMELSAPVTEGERTCSLANREDDVHRILYNGIWSSNAGEFRRQVVALGKDHG